MEVLQQYPWPGNVRELQNVVEQMIAIAGDEPVGVGDLPSSLLSAVSGEVTRSRDRRRHLADDLYDSLLSKKCDFWGHIQTLFINRDLTRGDLRALVRRGLSATGGSYRALLPLFGIDGRDYKKFLNFLSTHDCRVDYREYRPGGSAYTSPASISAAAASRHLTN
jgi:hypothetical protein